MRRFLLIGLLLAGAADAKPLSKPGTALPPPADAAPNCDAEAAKRFVGQPGASSAEPARIATDADVVRVIKPGQAVTMDFRAERLNLKLDDKGLVVSATCG